MPRFKSVWMYILLKSHCFIIQLSVFSTNTCSRREREREVEWGKVWESECEQNCSTTLFTISLRVIWYYGVYHNPFHKLTKLEQIKNQIVRSANLSALALCETISIWTCIFYRRMYRCLSRYILFFHSFLMLNDLREPILCTFNLNHLIYFVVFLFRCLRPTKNDAKTIYCCGDCIVVGLGYFIVACLKRYAHTIFT